MSCEPEKVTGLVDGALDAQERERIEAHLRDCTACQAQAEFERDLRRRLRALRAPDLPETLEARVRGGLRARRPRSTARWLLPLAAGLALLAVWAYGSPGIVAAQLAWDHGHCFGKDKLPAKVWTSDARSMESWLDERMDNVPALPEQAGGLDLIGGRQCPVLGRRVGHVYYASDHDRLSVYLVPGWVRIDRSLQFKRGNKNVRLLRTAGATVGLVSEEAEALDAFESALTTTYARLAPVLGPSARD